MTIEGALLSRLKSQVALVNNRVYAVKFPQGVTLPALTYQRISTVPEQVSGERAKTVHARYQVSAWAETFDGARDVADQVRGDGTGATGLDRFSGSLDSTVIQEILWIADQDGFEPELGQEGVFHVPQDFMVHYEGA